MLTSGSNERGMSKVFLKKKFFSKFSISTIDFPTFLQRKVLKLRLKLNIS
jgi:hypothetical protein